MIAAHLYEQTADMDAIKHHSQTGQSPYGICL